MVLDATLLSTQHYKVRIKGKVEQSRESPPLHLGVVAIEKGAFGLPLTKVTNNNNLLWNFYSALLAAELGLEMLSIEIGWKCPSTS